MGERKVDMMGPMVGGGGMMLLNLLFLVLIVIGVVLLIVWLVKKSGIERGHGEESALDILKKRYAKGEISKEEYERMKKDIS
ncbi:MAG: SHOCT domain-containing protein [Nitrospirota bacterium]